MTETFGLLPDKRPVNFWYIFDLHSTDGRFLVRNRDRSSDVISLFVDRLGKCTVLPYSIVYSEC
jgi:hypothetical protein